MRTKFSQTAAYMSSLADLLRGDLEQSQDSRSTVSIASLHRLKCVPEPTDVEVLKGIELKGNAREKFLQRVAKSAEGAGCAQEVA